MSLLKRKVGFHGWTKKVLIHGNFTPTGCLYPYRRPTNMFIVSTAIGTILGFLFGVWMAKVTRDRPHSVENPTGEI